ncbi:MAG: hypothetical protein K2G04_09740 [Oscillospiraceae bacterium]|nr:hypothetical protein [Oscillospiraceae bacterium]
MDCTVRAIATALEQDWDMTYIGVCLEGFCLKDMPSANHVWGSYLKRKGFVRNIIPDDYPDCYTVADFCADNPKGIFILALSSHVVPVIDGDYYDTWDSGDKIINYFWQRKEN